MNRPDHRSGIDDQSQQHPAVYPTVPAHSTGGVEMEDPEVQLLHTWPDRLLGGAVVILFGAIVVTILFEVVTRYIFNSPTDWSGALSRYLLAWMTFLGAALAYRLQAHIAIDIVTEYLSQRAARWLNGAVQAVVLIFLIALLIGGVSLVRATSDQMTPGLDVPVAWAYLAIPVGSGLMILSAAGRVFSIWRRGRSGGERDGQ